MTSLHFYRDNAAEEAGRVSVFFKNLGNDTTTNPVNMFKESVLLPVPATWRWFLNTYLLLTP